MDFEDDELYDESDVNIEDTYLTFSVNKEEYAIPVINVLEIVKLQKIIPVPDVADYIIGVTNLRGKIIPVMDIRKRLRIDEENFSNRTVIIVLELNSVSTGIIVDKVNDVIEITSENITLPSQMGASASSVLIRGISRINDSVRLVLDINSLLLVSSNAISNEIKEFSVV